MRQCILCREKKCKSEFLRIVKHNNAIEIDKGQKKDGRGAYICKECKLSDNLIKKRVLDRVFKQKVPDEIYDLLKENADG